MSKTTVNENKNVRNLKSPEKQPRTQIINNSTPMKASTNITKSGRLSKKSKIGLEAQINATIAKYGYLSPVKRSDSCIPKRHQTKNANKSTPLKTPVQTTKSVRTSRRSQVSLEAQINATIEKYGYSSPLKSDSSFSFDDSKYPKIVMKRVNHSTESGKKVKQKSNRHVSESIAESKKVLKLKNNFHNKKNKYKENLTKQNVFEKALSVLHSSAVPSSLPCRENEFFAVYNFLKGKLLEESGGCMYISGVPGTGKTATVYEVIRNLRDECEAEDIPDFRFIEINGLQLTEPYQCYVQLYKELSGKKTSSQNAANLLDKRFTKPLKSENEPIVLLVDELDLLCTRKQTILYHLFEWPNKPRSKLIVVSIANTMDLPERVMMNRVSSRLGMSRITFQPYNHKELQTILQSRLEGLSAFDSDGVQLIARKVAAISGDARRALDICRRAVEIAALEANGVNDHFVTMKHVDRSLQEIFSSPKLMAIRNASLQAQTFLRSIIQDFRITGLEEAKFIDVYRHHCSICKFEGFYTPTTNELFDVAFNLYDIRLILLDNSSVDLLRRIRLQVSVDDITFALNLKH
ncbi:origin recognition complex subunit 1-like isoform X2 [Leptotrombidium deliense]|uniref:Origin recognition complex subunit 1 n=1 Tax=Leptotrombidium deliense TaxID=299467 RepID=A0A443SH46_9ACAR|nr:origin recognition complex subunit 1-like isoform X2 [Leptotrombidium deliense]